MSEKTKKLTKKEKDRRKKISESLKKYWEEISKTALEKRKKNISKALKKYWSKKKKVSKKKVSKKVSKKKVSKKKVSKKKVSKKKVSKKKVSKKFDKKDWKSKINYYLNLAGEKMGFDYRVHVVRNADNSVDGELRIIVPSNRRTNSLLIKLSQSSKVPSGTWMSVGARFEPTNIKDEDIRDNYRKYYGLLDTGAAYSRQKYKQEHFATALRFSKTTEIRHEVKAKEIVLRLYYNPKDERPKMKGKRPKKGKNKSLTRKRLS